MQDIKRKALHGGLAKLCGLGANIALRLSFMAVLARMLEPHDFGLVAMVTAVITFLELFSSAGLSSAAVQRSTITEERISSLFWINILVGILLALLCLAIAPLLTAFYQEPRLFWVTVSMGVAFICSSAGVQFNVLMQRQMRFIALTVIEVLSQLTSLGVGICLAFSGYGYWALVAAAVVLPATMTACMWVVTAWVPGRPHWDAETHSMLRFGGTVTLNGVAVYIAYNLDKVLVGRVWGAEALGYYATAAQLVFAPTGNLNKAIGGVAFSALSRLQHDLARFRSYFLKGYTLVTSITLPITVFVGIFAKDIVLVILGPNWTEVIPIIRLLTPSILVFGIIDPLAWLMWASGRQVRSFKISLVIAVLMISAYFIGLPYGFKGVAFAFSTATILWLIPHVIWCVHGTTISAWDLFRIAGRPLLAAAAAAAIAFAALSYLGEPQSPFIRLFLEAGIMGVAYLTILLFLMGQRDFYFELLRGIKSPSPS
jgi:PST family polysaccharide transporter